MYQRLLFPVIFESIKSAYHSLGRRVHVYCIADACDHPAMCRVAGFADHSHLSRFCTRCKIPRQDLNSMGGVVITGGEYISRNRVFAFFLIRLQCTRPVRAKNTEGLQDSIGTPSRESIPDSASTFSKKTGLAITHCHASSTLTQ